MDEATASVPAQAAAAGPQAALAATEAKTTVDLVAPAKAVKYCRLRLQKRNLLLQKDSVLHLRVLRS